MQYAYNWGMTATSRFTVADRRAANLVGAFALTLVDRLYEAAEQVVGGSTASAALTTLLTYRGIFAVTSIERLRRILGLSHSATVRLVDRLAEVGYLERRSSPDGREASLTLTPIGERTARRILRERQRLLDEVLSVLDASERQTLARAIEKLLAATTGGRWEARNICRLCDHELCHRNPSCPVGDAASALGQ